MTIGFWQTLRQVLLYPVLAVGGVAWALGFWIRWRSTGCAGDLWAGRMGAAAATLGLMGTVSLWMATATGGFSVRTTMMITLGVAAVAVVLVWGALRLLVSGWRRGPSTNASQHEPSANERRTERR